MALDNDWNRVLASLRDRSERRRQFCFGYVEAPSRRIGAGGDY
jgi:hypothetical protein